jgi:glucose-1-phosphate thymidylyltransferase
MVRLAGRPILGHILNNLAETAIEEVCVVVGGAMKEQIISYAEQEFSDRFNLVFVLQESAEGLGHSIYQARDVVGGEPAIIALGDMLFENGYVSFLSDHKSLGDIDGSIGVKCVDQPQHYGVVETDSNRIKRLIEKPDNPPSNYAISGVYIIENTNLLFEALDHIVENDLRGAGDEYQLTDALQRMIDQGAKLDTFPVEEWYDCGRPETLLEANRVLLSQMDSDGANTDNAIVIDPVDIGENITIEESIIGPNVSVDDNSTITGSIIQDSIVGQDASLDDVNIADSIVGDRTNISGEPTHLNVGDNSQINL